MALKAHLEPAAHIEGRRASRRQLRMETSGTLPGGLEANVILHNISAAGLLLETQVPLDVGETLAIDLPQVGPVGAEIVWQSGVLYGCAFQQALGEAALAATELRSGASQPRTSPQEAAVSFGDPLGARLNRLRREQGLTLAQVASALGVSKPTVWAWEKGKARPLPERIDAIAATLGVDPIELGEATPHGDGARLVEECRLRIATAYGTEPAKVRIMIEV